MGAELVEGADVRVIDSRTTTLGLGLLVLTAARAVRDGLSVQQVCEVVEAAVQRINIFAAIRHLTQLRRSGRVGLAPAVLAGLLSIKPILNICDGNVEVVDRVRSWQRAVTRTIELARAAVGDARVRLGVVHTNAEAEARALRDRLAQAFTDIAEIIVAEAGPALAAHAGPGAVGVCSLVEDTGAA